MDVYSLNDISVNSFSFKMFQRTFMDNTDGKTSKYGHKLEVRTWPLWDFWPDIFWNILSHKNVYNSKWVHLKHIYKSIF